MSPPSDNPGPIAVSLHYEAPNTPTVRAMGDGALAQQIIALAQAHEVPIYRDPQLLTQLCQLELDETIPPYLYIAVAEVIAFAYHLKGRRPEPREAHCNSEPGL